MAKKWKWAIGWLILFILVGYWLIPEHSNEYLVNELLTKGGDVVTKASLSCNGNRLYLKPAIVKRLFDLFKGYEKKWDGSTLGRAYELDITLANHSFYTIRFFFEPGVNHLHLGLPVFIDDEDVLASNALDEKDKKDLVLIFEEFNSDIKKLCVQ